MKKPKYPYRIVIIFLLLTVPPIGATQLGWHLYDKQTGFDYGMIVGTVCVIYAAWLMYEKTKIPLQNWDYLPATDCASYRCNTIRLVLI